MRKQSLNSTGTRYFIDYELVYTKRIFTYINNHHTCRNNSSILASIFFNCR